MGESLNIAREIYPVIVVIVALIIGIIVDRIILKKLQRVSADRITKMNEVLIRPFRGIIILWFVLLGITGAIGLIELAPGIGTIIQKSILAVFILSSTVVLARMVAGSVNVYEKTVESVIPSASIFRYFLKATVYIIGFLIILQSLGISITPILTALGIGGLAVALALQDTLTNLLSGFQIIASKQVKPGDYVKLETGEEGYVVDITWRNTAIRALPNNMVIVPNSKIASTIVTNFFQPEQEMTIPVQLGVSYDSDLERVERVTIEVAQEVMREIEGGIPEFEPFIRYHTFGDFSINFSVILRISEYVNQYIIKHEFIKRVHKRYLKEGITIPFPVRTVHLHGTEKE